MWTPAVIAIACSIEGAPIEDAPRDAEETVVVDAREDVEGDAKRGDAKRGVSVLDASAHAQEGNASEASLTTAVERPRTRLQRYLTRAVAPSARFLDHGILSVAVAGGYPHRYRVEVGIGLLDHVSLGVTAHWLPRDARPRWTPKVSLALFRNPRVEVGVHYFQSLYPPPERDLDPATLSFRPRVHWLLASVSFSQRWISGGFDGGALRSLDRDPGKDPDKNGNNAAITRWRIGGGVHVRAGTRRFGFTAQALAPRLFMELVFDLRFGAFELRPRAGWKPSGIMWSSDRRIPAVVPRRR